MNVVGNKKNKSLILGTMIYALGSFGTKFLIILIVPLYTYYISPADFGNYDLLNTTVSLLSPLITMRISDAAYRWMIRDQKNTEICIATSYKLLLKNCAIFSLLLIIINQFITIWNCYYFIIILVLDRTLECLQQLLRGLKRQKLYAISGVIYTAVFLALNLFKVCYLGQGVLALLQSTIFSQVVTIILILALEKKLLQVNLKKDYRYLQKAMLKFSIPLVPSALGWWVMGASDRYIIKAFLGSGENGIYAIACKFPLILSTILAIFNNAWTDLVLSDIEDNDENFKYYSSIFKQLYKVSFGLAIILIPLTQIVTQVILSESYRRASAYISFLYLGAVFQGFSLFFSVAYLRKGQTKGAAITSIYGAVVNFIINIVFIKYIGLFAASVSTFIGFFTMWIMRFRDTKDKLSIKVDKIRFLFYLFICIVLSIYTIWSGFIANIILTVVSVLVFYCDNRVVIIKLICNVIGRLGNINIK